MTQLIDKEKVLKIITDRIIELAKDAFYSDERQ
jgi:hypothetical protein